MSDQLGGLINSKHTHTPGRDQEFQFQNARPKALPAPTWRRDGTPATIATQTSAPRSTAIVGHPLPIRAFALRYGHTRTPLALVAPDFDWPDMWRIAWPDGRLSDLVNLPRAKDAAEAISERGPPARNRRLFHWHTSKTPRGAAPVRQTGTALARHSSDEKNASLIERADEVMSSSSSHPCTSRGPLQKTPSAGERAWR
jgi:hypothetical protein